MKKCLTILLLLFVLTGGVFAQTAPSKGFKKSIVATVGLNSAGQPAYTYGTQYGYNGMASKVGIGGQILFDAYYYFIPSVGINFGIGFGTFHSKWEGTDSFGHYRLHKFRGWYLMPRVGAAFNFSNFFVNIGLQLGITLFRSKTIDRIPKYVGWENDLAMGDSGVPVGLYLNLGYRITSGNLLIPIGIEYILLNPIYFDHGGYNVLVHSWNLFIGIMF